MNKRKKSFLCWLGFHDEFLNLVPTKFPKILNTQVITPELFNCVERLECSRCGAILSEHSYE